MPRLDLQIVGPGLKYLERKALYTLKVTNPGDAPATNVTVGDVVPDGFKVLAASDGAATVSPPAPCRGSWARLPRDRRARSSSRCRRSMSASTSTRPLPPE